MNRFLRSCVIGVIVASVAGFGCHQEKKKTVKAAVVRPGETAPEVFAKAEKYLKKKDYESAVQYFDAVRNQFPGDPLVPEAQLKSAQSYFEWKQYSQSAEAYEQFRRLHPTHEQADYALFRQGESHFRQAPKTIDRDLTECRQAVVIFDDFFHRYPTSTHLTSAHQMAFQCRQRMAGQEFYVGRFYYRWGKYKAAAKRLEGVLQGHTGFGYDEQAAWYLGLSYAKLKDYAEARRVWTQLAERYPNSTYGKKAQSKLKGLPVAIVQKGSDEHEEVPPKTSQESKKDRE